MCNLKSFVWSWFRLEKFRLVLTRLSEKFRLPLTRLSEKFRLVLTRLSEKFRLGYLSFDSVI